MTRALWKGPFIKDNILKLAKKNIKSSSKIYKTIRVMSRNSIIFPSFVDLVFEVHNGYKFALVRVKENMIGKKFGEFVLTRKIAKHKQKV